MKKTNVHFMCLNGLQNFVMPIVDELKKDESFNVTIDLSHFDQSKIENTDVIWFEWANELALQLSRDYFNFFAGKKVILRLHSYEVFVDEFMNKINWNIFSDIIFVSEFVRDMFIQKMNKRGITINFNTHIIKNGVDLNKFKLKKKEPEKNRIKIAYVGYINHKKGPMLLLQAVKEISKRIAGVELHIAGVFQEERYSIYFEKMVKEMEFPKGCINFHGWVVDINSFLDDKDFIISTSLFEANPVGLLEAMAKGVIPIVHGYPGVENTFIKKDEFIGDVWNTIFQLVNSMFCLIDVVDVLVTLKKVNKDLFLKNRMYVGKYYNLTDKVAQIKVLLTK